MLKLIQRYLENVNARVNNTPTSTERDEANDSTSMSFGNKVVQTSCDNTSKIKLAEKVCRRR